jgi:type IV pilus assembly protein PilC
VYIKYLISNFCRTLGILLESGIPLLQSLEVVLRSTENELIRKDISRMKQGVIQGGKIGYSLREPVLFPPMVSQMIRVGEETASLAPMLIRISDHYDRELEVLVESLSTIIEPLVIILLGAVIGLVIIAVYLPLFDMTEFIGG